MSDERITEIWACEAGHTVTVIQCLEAPAPFEAKVKCYNRFHSDDWPDCTSHIWLRKVLHGQAD